MPAKAGIQPGRYGRALEILDSRFRGNDGFRPVCREDTATLIATDTAR